MKRTSRGRGITRREFEQQALAASLGAAFDLSGQRAAADARSRLSAFDAPLQTVEVLPAGITRTWIGPSFWANRLQDWRLHDGRIECLTGAAGDEVRTVAVLTRELAAGAESAHVRVRAGLLDDAGDGGFCGFLVGAGGGTLDYRAAALVQKASGTGGGLLCVYETDGALRFRDHTSEDQPLAFAELPAFAQPLRRGRASTPGAEVVLQLDIVPAAAGRFTVTLTARDPRGSVVAGASREGVAEADLVGGIALVSSPYAGKAGARFWFTDLRAGGEKIAAHPDRVFGPILGTLYSLNGSVMKLGAQLAPVGDLDQLVRLETRAAGGAWRDGGTASLAPGYVAHFRVENWDSTRDHEYRVMYGSEPAVYAGMIRKDPTDRPTLSIGLFSCATAAARSFESGSGEAELPRAEPLGRYTSKNVYFPHAELVLNAGRHAVDLLVFAGDQLYEGSPTRRDNSVTPTLDYLYKWSLWLWSFRELTRHTPAVLLVDDHDVYHGNVWGNGGRPAPDRDQNRGGYRCSGDFVNIVQRTQCGHNPDAYDPTPIDQGIGVYYGTFRYGGVSFAIIEDRKFKTAPIQGTDLDVHEAELLGSRQEQFLAEWAAMPDAGVPRVCLAQTLFACVQTSPAGKPLLDFDSNGYPKLARDRAIALLARAHALVLSGDQHLATVVRHGIDSFTDGVLQFAGPAAGTSWQRWFEPRDALPNARSPYTGDFVDAFGNKVRVLAVANPKVSFNEYRTYRKGRAQGLGDRRLKSEGCGVVRIERAAREVLIECWPWNVDPQAAGAAQFAGWPLRVPFDQI
jgi:alkaline phosphatase D